VGRLFPERVKRGCSIRSSQNNNEVKGKKLRANGGDNLKLGRVARVGAGMGLEQEEERQSLI